MPFHGHFGLNVDSRPCLGCFTVNYILLSHIAAHVAKLAASEMSSLVILAERARERERQRVLYRAEVIKQQSSIHRYEQLDYSWEQGLRPNTAPSWKKRDPYLQHKYFIITIIHSTT